MAIFQLIAPIDEHSFRFGGIGENFLAVAHSDSGVLSVTDPEIIAELRSRPDLWREGPPTGCQLVDTGLVADAGLLLTC